MIGHGLGPGGRDWFLEEGEEMHLRMKKRRGRRRRKGGDRRLSTFVNDV